MKDRRISYEPPEVIEDGLGAVALVIMLAVVAVIFMLLSH